MLNLIIDKIIHVLKDLKNKYVYNIKRLFWQIHTYTGRIYSKVTNNDVN